MRLKYSKLCTFLIIIVNIVLVYCTWKLFIVENWQAALGPGGAFTERAKPRDRIQSTNRHIKKAITVIFRDFYHFDNDLKESIDSLLNLVSNVQILVVYDDEPYPPLSFEANYTATRPNVKFINLAFDVTKSARALSPVSQIKTKYVLLMPDSVRIGGRSIIQKMLREIERMDELDDGQRSQGNLGPSQGGRDKEEVATAVATRKIVAVPFASNVKTIGNCCSIQLDFPNWTIEYSVKNGTTNCDMVSNVFFLFFNTLY